MAIESASTSRRILFKSRGGTYSAIFMAETGDLWQEYDGEPGAVTKYYPDFEENPVNVILTLTSSRSTGLITPSSRVYRVNGEELTFSGTTLTAPAKYLGANNGSKNGKNTFALTTGRDLVIQGNLVNVAAGNNFTIEVTATVGDDTLTASTPVSIAKHTDTDILRVTIAPMSIPHYTITEKNGSCKVRADVYKNGATVTPAGYKWYKLGTDGWGSVIGTTNELEIKEKDIETYAIFKVEVWETRVSGNCDGSDVQGIMDASDPYDITVAIQIGTFKDESSFKATTDETLTDDMPDNKALRYKPTMVRRDANETPVTGMIEWQSGYLVTATGVKSVQIPYDEEYGSYYYIKVGEIKELGYGEVEFVFSGTII